ncbi:glycosyltransferase [Thalassorhabdomicrobium marinisediminis]|uniref:Glycosyltransferase family 4 protein n=1 Tax=Thalassorhabdomicrobium marinisediminis TaxID=2170577 RepID=A0A2T7FUM3_9RHOB|nr:glycosyltransferase [Thalassorhabdomicrobium marinisediminis]PVA05871.1 glycosyltransferase family 4 protein [Thalassorhabdomicrobium marinisediminis]
MRFRIAIVGHIRHPIAPPFMGGMEAFTHTLAGQLARRGHDVTLLASADSAVGLPGGVTLLPITDAHYDTRYPWHEFHGTDILNDHLDVCYARAARLLLDGGFDVIHNNALHRFIPRLSRAQRLPMVTSLHIPPFKVLRRALSDSAAPWHLSSVTSARQAEIWWPDGAPDTAHVVHNGIELQRWPYHAQGDGSAIWAGRITPTKGTALAAEAAQRAGVPLRICGTIEHRDYFNDAVRPHLGGGVEYVGHLAAADLAQAYGQASVALFTPLWEEPFGLAAVEAMATGLPVASTGQGAVREVLGNAGVIARSDTAADLAEALVQAADIPPTVPRSRVESYFSAETMIDGFERLYARARAEQDVPLAEVFYPSHALQVGRAGPGRTGTPVGGQGVMAAGYSTEPVS